MYKNYIKRVVDIIVAIILLILFSPIIIVTYFTLLVLNKGDALFFQARPGYKCLPFVIYKFKTMRDEYDANGKLLPDEIRLTSFGKVVRKLSIDELLQLFNVIKGDMSLVGPRPLLLQYLSQYTSEQIKRHDVRPGITGLAQVKGRNGISWENKFQLDLEYVANVSFKLDVKILCLTFIDVIKQKGINAKNHATMEEFKNSNY
jgi:undecaprenyl phosphate N,N'-diacetylbacillosamine 1-phosphate transferase